MVGRSPTDLEVEQAVRAAWNLTDKPRSSNENKTGNQRALLSASWVRTLGNGLFELTKTARPNAKLHHRIPKVPGSEFLFDIAINDGPGYFGDRIWAVESEFAFRNENLGRDFAKLLWADVEHRLIVYSKSNVSVFHDRKQHIKIGQGSLYRYCVPHPKFWHDSDACSQTVFEVFDSGSWWPAR